MFVHELDMPPMAYFCIPLDIPGAAITVRAREIKAGPFADKAHAETFLKLGVSRVHQELLTRGGGIIWWRIRPEVNEYPDEQPGAWHTYARCGTSPTLPDSFWREMGDRGE
jgi:hypothetical protein